MPNALNNIPSTSLPPVRTTPHTWNWWTDPWCTCGWFDNQLEVLCLCHLLPNAVEAHAIMFHLQFSKATLPQRNTYSTSSISCGNSIRNAFQNMLHFLWWFFSPNYTFHRSAFSVTLLKRANGNRAFACVRLVWFYSVLATFLNFSFFSSCL